MSVPWEWVSIAQEIIAHEQGTISKEWGGHCPIALIYPNTYYVGMSSLGFQSVYGLLNAVPGVVCERVFYGAPGLTPEQASRIALESQRTLDNFPVLAFSLSFEIDYLNVVHMLRLNHIPVAARQRDDTHPLLIAGGPAISANPLPVSTIFDAILIGEGEEAVPQLAHALLETLPAGRKKVLATLADLPGVYVPLLHGPSEERPRMQSVKRQWVADLDAHPTHSIVLSKQTEFGDIYLIEIARGCARRCPFCLAGHIYLPHRQRSLETVLEQARVGLRYRKRIGLVSAAASDYRQIDDLVTRLEEMGAKISVSSLRVRPLSEKLLQALADAGDRTLTIAPEAGSERLRSFIQKGVQRADIVKAVEKAQALGFQQLKLYFMIGLPTETEDDVLEICNLVADVSEIFTHKITVNVTPFVPKAKTPFERESMCGEPEIGRRLKLLHGTLRRKGIELRAEAPKWAVVQGVLARGDRRVSLALEQMLVPTWKEWQRALRAIGLVTNDYLRARLPGEELPWAAIIG